LGHGHDGHQYIFIPQCVPHFANFSKTVVLRLSEHDDVIETQTIRYVPPKFFRNSVPGPSGGIGRTVPSNLI